MAKNELIELKNFFLATRDSGYKHTASAIAEVVDNAIDATAKNINIKLFKNDAGYQVTILDDGEGMTPAVLQLALRFGGSTKFNSRKSTGRFGMGLPNASLSQTLHVDLYSWKKKNRLYCIGLDVERIANGEVAELEVPKMVQELPIGEPESSSGSLVEWKNCDRLSYKNLKSLVNHLHEKLGQIFRTFILEEGTITVNKEAVEAFDPLCLAKGRNLIGGIRFGEPLRYQIRIPGKANTSAEVVVRFVELPIEKWHSLSNPQKRMNGITKKAGVSVLRAGREIDYGWFFMGKKRKENYDDWWRCEVRFDPELDELFGVTHTKQEIHPTQALLEVLTPDMENISRILNSRVRDRFVIVKSQQLGEYSKSEAERVDHYIEPPKHELNGEKLPELDHQLILGKAIIKGLTYLLSRGTVKEEDFFITEFNKEFLSVLLNKDHPFYDKLYVPLLTAENSETKHFLKQLEMLIFAVARSETLSSNETELKAALKYRKDWSKILAAFLS